LTAIGSVPKKHEPIPFLDSTVLYCEILRQNQDFQSKIEKLEHFLKVRKKTSQKSSVATRSADIQQMT